MWKSVQVNLATSLTICQTIEGLLQKSLGPNSLHTMLTSPTGNVVITGDGHTLLTSLHLSHPIARWIVDQVKGHHGVTGDNSKAFILIVTEMLRQLQNVVATPRSAMLEDCSAKQELMNISRALETILSEVFPGVILPALVKHSVRVNLVEAEREEVVSICKKLVKTALSGKFNRQSVEYVVSLIVELVCDSSQDISNLREVVKCLISEYNVTCIEVPNQPISKSRLYDGVVLTRNFVVQSENVDSLANVSFVILSCSLDKWIPEVHSTLVARNSEDLTKLLQYGTLQTRTLIGYLNRCNVMLILSSEALSDITLSCCRATGISAVHMIPDEELNRLAHLTKTDIIYDSSDIATLALKPGRASFCRSVVLGQRVGVHLGLDRSVSPSTPKQLVLCAPTQGICRQWFIAVFNTVKSISMWLDTGWLTDIEMEKDRGTHSLNETSSSGGQTVGCESKDSGTSELNVSESCIAPTNKSFKLDGANEHTLQRNCTQEAICLPGGGHTEFLLHKLFHNLSIGNSDDCSLNLVRDPSVVAALQILSKTALCIPRNLHRNSFVPKSRRSSFAEMLSNLKYGAIVGIDSKSGSLCDPSECGVLEPLSGRLMLWRNAAKTVVGLLKFNTIIGVNNLAKENHD